jgi:hypothetical protein
MSLMEPLAGVRLERAEEPADMRIALRDALLGGADGREGFADDICLGLWLWERWRPALEPVGMDRETFIDVIVDYGREVWLWLTGERMWDHLLDGLSGRVARRIPVH